MRCKKRVAMCSQKSTLGRLQNYYCGACGRGDMVKLEVWAGVLVSGHSGKEKIQCKPL